MTHTALPVIDVSPWRDPQAAPDARAEVARRLEALTAAGIESFLLSGDAALEDALRYGEELLPLVRAQAPASCREVA